MKNIQRSSLSIIILLTFSIIALGQASKMVGKATDTTLLKIESKIYDLSNKLESISSQLRQVDTVQNKTFKEVTRDAFWDDLKTSLVASFIYDILGFNGNTPGSFIAKTISFLYLLYLCLKARYWWKIGRHKKSDTRALDVFGGIVTCFQAGFSLFVFFASFIFSNNDILDKTAFNKANENIQSLNKQIQNMKKVDFVALFDNLKRVQQLKMDTLSLINISYLSKLERRIEETNMLTQVRFNSLTQKADSLQKQIKVNPLPTNYAKSGLQQAIQTGLLIVLTIAVLIFLNDYFKR